MQLNYDDDRNALMAYNARKSQTSRLRLQMHMDPAPYDGDPFTARVVLLMNNPGFNPLTSTPEDHRLSFDGWPLAGLHPDAPETFRTWYSRPLGSLIRAYGAQYVSQRVALLQLNPWASQSFDSRLMLPSRTYQTSLAILAAKRGAVMVVGRSFETWGHALAGLPLHYVRNRLNPTLSPGGLQPAGWAAVKAAMELKG